MYDFTLNRVQASAFASQHGWDEFMAALESKSATFGRLPCELYSVSTEWTTNPNITCLKARGARGDLLVKLV